MTTSLQRNEPTWPFLLVLVALFILSVASPRAWRVVERPDPPVPKAKKEAPSTAQQTGPMLAESSSGRAQEMRESASGQRVGEGYQSAMVQRPVGTPPELEAASAAGLATGRDAREDDRDDMPQTGACPDQQVAESSLRPMTDEDERLAPLPPEAESPPGESRLTDTGSPAPKHYGLWSPPASLLVLLEGFADHNLTRDWVARVRDLIDRLGEGFESRADVLPIIHEFNLLVEQSADLQNQLDDDPRLAAQFRQVRYALIRRLSVWKAIHLAGGLQVELGSTTPADRDRLSETIRRLESRLGTGPVAESWREFLGVRELKDLCGQVEADPERIESQIAELAGRIVMRVDRQELSASQEQLLQEAPLAGYLDELRFWSAAPVQMATLLSRLEDFESSGSHATAQPLLQAYYRLARSSQDRARWLAQCLDVLYRNANLRIAITGELLNRLAPQRPADQRAVADVILNRPVYGSSRAETAISFRLIPDPQRARVALVVRGVVNSLTYSQAGPATIWNDGFARYVAEKSVEITPAGLVSQPAVIHVENSVRIRDVATSFDSVPVLGFLTQEVARQQATRYRLEASEEARWKLAAHALREIESETESQFSKLNQRWSEEVLGPLHRLHLTPTWLAAQTTEDRLVIRVRLAGAFQPGGYTLRPFALADSLASCQIHQTTINNFLQRLNLEGQTFTVAELQTKLRQKLNLPEDEEGEESLHADAKITFAQQDAVRVDFADGKLIITLAVAELASPPNRWRNFQVRAVYRPEIQNDRLQFVREGVIQLVGPMDIRSQIALRGVFSRTFSRNRPWEVSPGFLQQRENLNDLTITQLVLENGWLGFAVGKRPVVASTSSRGSQTSSGPQASALSRN